MFNVALGPDGIGKRSDSTTRVPLTFSFHNSASRSVVSGNLKKDPPSSCVYPITMGTLATLCSPSSGSSCSVMIVPSITIDLLDIVSGGAANETIGK